MAKKRSELFDSICSDIFSTQDEDENSEDYLYSSRFYQMYRDRPVHLIAIKNLIPDPDNREIYGDYKTDGLAESIRTNGFKGIVFAYPIESDPKKYQIESGHRSAEAAEKAGLREVPVIITDPPKTDAERRRRLILGNLHGRVYTPIKMASQVGYLYETYQMESEELKLKGQSLPKEINEMIADDLEVSRALVLKYRQFLSLSPDLKQLGDSGDYSWSALAQASSLTARQQEQLKDRILAHTKMMGKDACTRKWIENEIKEFRYVKTEPTKYNFDPRNILAGLGMGQEQPTMEKSVPVKRRKNGYKEIQKSCEFLETAFAPTSFIKDKQKKEVINQLIYMKKLIDKKICELDQ